MKHTSLSLCERMLYVTCATAVMMAILWTLLLLAGCMPVSFPHAQLSRSLDVTDPPDVAWSRVVTTTMNMGGMIWQQDSTQHWLQAFVGSQGGCRPTPAPQSVVALAGLTGTGQASLSVRVLPLGTGSRLEVSHQLSESYLPGSGDGTLSADFLTCYAQR